MDWIRPVVISVLSLVFVVLVLVAHVLEPALVRHPLSFCRDGRAAAVGWAAFVALDLAILGYCLVYLRTATPLRRYAFGPLVALGLMVVVTATPTFTLLHDMSAGAMLVWVMLFFAVRMLDVSPWRAGGFLMAVTLGVVSMLAIGAQWSQKLLVLIQVVAMNIDARRMCLEK